MNFIFQSQNYLSYIIIDNNNEFLIEKVRQKETPLQNPDPMRGGGSRET